MNNFITYSIKMPSSNPTIKKAFKDGVISKGQYDKLSDGLLLGIIKKKRGSSTGGKSKGKVQAKGRCSSQRGKNKGKGDHTKEKRHKLGKEAHKRGRPPLS